MAKERLISRKVASDATSLAQVIIKHKHPLAAFNNEYFDRSFRKILERIDLMNQRLDFNIGFVEWQARSKP